MLFNLMGTGKPVLIQSFVVITLAGVIGSIIDSFLGATVQAQYLCAEKGTITERPYSGSVKNTLQRGIPIINNDMVNFLSITLAVILVFTTYAVFFNYKK